LIGNNDHFRKENRLNTLLLDVYIHDRVYVLQLLMGHLLFLDGMLIQVVIFISFDNGMNHMKILLTLLNQL
jgi:hypothetical protein